MPSGKTHDVITVLLAAPAFALAYGFTASLWIAAVVAAAFLFGGFMFGPDLDTASVQFYRWRIFRFFWTPYRIFFRHRSRWTHGLIFGTLFRVVYFMGAATLAAFLATWSYMYFAGGEAPFIWDFARVWSKVRGSAESFLGVDALPAIFVGMWTGAAAHTFADMAGTYVKTGRRGGFL